VKRNDLKSARVDATFVVDVTRVQSRIAGRSDGDRWRGNENKDYGRMHRRADIRTEEGKGRDSGRWNFENAKVD
jgi:hypothetical protein